MSNNPSVIQAAVEYARLGFSPVPVWGVINGVCQCPRGADCTAPAKHPRGASWADFCTNDPAAVAQVFGSFGGCNVGLLLGPDAGLIDCEFDDEEGEETAMRLLNDRPTPTYTSARSTHRLYRFRDIGIAKAVAKASGLEVRLGAGGRAAQSVAPPSLHASGERYRWLDGLSISDVALAELPQAVVDLLHAAPEPTPSGSDLAFVVAHDSDLATAPGAGKGERNTRLCSLVGTYLATRGADADLVTLALAWGDRCSPKLPHDEVLRVVASLATKQTLKQPPPQASSSIQSRRYATIQQREVAWLWQDRIPLGRLSLVAGEPGLGKTFLCTDLAARVSSGRPFPDGAAPTLGDVGILTYEDDASDTIKPRLVAAGADCSRIHHIDAAIDARGREATVSLGEHLAALERWVASLPELRLLVVDPLTAGLGRVDGNSNTDIRAVLGPVAKLAEKFGLAVLGVSHLSKGDRKALHRVLGSIAFVAAARVVWLVGRDPDDEQRRLMLPIKNNLADASGLAYRVLDGCCEWESGEVHVKADELEDDSHTPREEAEQWLAAKLEGGPAPSADLIAAAKKDGIAERTLYRAKNTLKIKSDKINNVWHWFPQQAEASGNVYVVE